jgi:hypothetical protein
MALMIAHLERVVWMNASSGFGGNAVIRLFARYVKNMAFHHGENPAAWHFAMPTVAAGRKFSALQLE